MIFPRKRWKKIVFILAIFIVVIISALAVYESIYFKPQPFFEVPFRDRIQSKTMGEVNVSVAVLSVNETKQVFGVNLGRKGIQPVWVRVKNNDTKPYYLMASGLDHNYFSPLETAYAKHSLFSSSRNRRLDEHIRVLGFRNPIAPGTSVSGFIFANLDEGMKVVDVDLIGRGKTLFFTFFVPVPGSIADYHDVDFEKLYPNDEITKVDENELRAAIERLPCCTTNEDGSVHGDPLNLVLIGSREDIIAAFIRRGWLHAEKTYGKAIWKTIKSFLFGSRYRYSPVSPLYFNGRPQDFAAQKPRHTIHQRNHLRVWLSSLRYQGMPVWIGQVSRDIGVRLTLKTWPPVTHKIDPDIDEALYSLLEDLLYSQQVAKVGWANGVGALTRLNPGRNLTGDPYFTAGRRLVMRFDRRPYSFEDIKIFDWAKSPVSGRLERLTTSQQKDFDKQ